LPANILNLQRQTLQVNVNLANSLTLVQTVINITMISPISVLDGFKINVTVALGQFVCNSLGLNSNLLNLTTISCTSSQLYLSCIGPITASSTYWLSANYLTYLSTASNIISIDMKSFSNY
jgi:hypothetical protein